MRFRRKPLAYKKIVLIVVTVFVLGTAIPLYSVYSLKNAGNDINNFSTQFPTTVDLENKTIIKDDSIDAYLENKTPLQANVFLSFKSLKDLFKRLNISIAKFSTSKNLAFVGNERVVTITPGMRKEEVANAFGKVLGWNETQKKTFLTAQEDSTLPLKEGSFYPGTYVVSRGSSPEVIQDLVNKRFIANILSKYSDELKEKVSLETALNVAALIQRETIGTEDMRLVSGIIWNRIFNNMNLQLDASLQYAKANLYKNNIWWPAIYPNDKYIKSPYNTYINEGLPPAAIANPSLAAVLAALNPLQTDCVFYFHDRNGDIHCTAEYKEHVALLKQYYGQGR